VKSSQQEENFSFEEDDEGPWAEETESGTGETVYILHAAQNAKRIRLDMFLTRSIQNASRNKVQQLIEAGGVWVNEKSVTKPGRMVLPGETIRCVVPVPRPQDICAEEIPLSIVYEDDEVLIVNKEAGMVTHPAYGNYTGTLVNGLLFHVQSLSMERGKERAGILHRLDKDTSGLLCVAKTDFAMQFIAKQFAAHTTDREYHAIVWGRMPGETGIIDAPLARHKSDRKKMAVVEGGKGAITEYIVLREFDDISLIKLKLRTGRTHQIRVHLSSIHHPIFGDPTYGGRHIKYGKITQRYKSFIQSLLDVLPRQALHAKTLGFIHPLTKQRVFYECPLPDDMNEVLRRIEAYYAV